MQIEDMEADKLALTIHACIARLGEIGRDGREALIERLKNEDDVHAQEGMAQLADALAAVDVD